MNQEKYNEWKQNPTTKYFMGYLEFKRQEIISTWENGGFTTVDVHHSDRLNSEALTKAGNLKEVLLLEFDDIEGYDDEL